MTWTSKTNNSTWELARKDNNAHRTSVSSDVLFPTHSMFLASAVAN